MIENINDFISLALLMGFVVLLFLMFLNSLNKKRARKHIEEEYYYYRDVEDFDDGL